MNRGRQFFRGGSSNPDLPRRRRYQPGYNQYNDQSEQRQQQQPPPPPPPRDGGNDSSVRRLDELTQGFKTDIAQLRLLFVQLEIQLEDVVARVKELESIKQQPQPQLGPPKEAGDWDPEKDKRRKFKLSKQREKRAAKRAAMSESASQQGRHQKILNPTEQATTSNSDKQPLDSTTTTTTNANNQNDDTTTTTHADARQPIYTRRTNRERRTRRDFKPLPKVSRNTINDDSTTQAAEPSSEDRPEGDDGREGTAKERVKVLRRKKPHFSRRNYNNRRRRADSSERNSNDTSPQNEANGHDDYQPKRKGKRRTYVELSESELNAAVQSLKDDFLTLGRPLKDIKNTMNEKGPKVAYGFAVSILDHALCDVTSPTKLSEIAKNLYQLLVSDDNTSEVDFQQGFYGALNDISKREDDIAIDAPRYMDTLGQVLADCVIPMNNKHKYLIRKFLNKCVESYSKHNRAVLLASIMKGIAGAKTDRFAKEIWDIAQLNWENLLEDGINLPEFLESHDVKFTTQAFSPEPRKLKKTPKELEKFADDVTSLVEKKCAPQTLEDLVKDLNLEPDERVDYLGNFIYAIVRGCLITDSGAYKLNIEALNQYSSILNAKHEEQDAIALYSLTALTKLWHQYNCPQDLLRTILVALHNHGTASFEALDQWLNSESLTNIPGIGAARLNSKRYIEDLGANLKS